MTFSALERIEYGARIIVRLCAALLCGVLVYEVLTLSPKVREIVANANRTSLALADYAEAQTADLRSERTQKMISHSFQIGEAGLLTIQKLNRTTIPRVNLAVDELTETERKLGRLVERTNEPIVALASFITDTNKSLNQDLVPRVAAVIDGLGATVDDIQELVNAGTVTIDDLGKIARNGDIPKIVASLAGTAAHLENISASADTGMQAFPDLMSSFQKYARASTVWQKRLYLAMIIRQLAAIPLRLP